MLSVKIRSSGFSLCFGSFRWCIRLGGICCIARMSWLNSRRKCSRSYWREFGDCVVGLFGVSFLFSSYSVGMVGVALLCLFSWSISLAVWGLRVILTVSLSSAIPCAFGLCFCIFFLLFLVCLVFVLFLFWLFLFCFCCVAAVCLV